MRHRKLLILIIFLLVVMAVAGVVYYRMARPGRAVFLLPDGDLVVYADLAPIPFVNVGQYIDVDQLPGQSDPEYRDFIKQTNFHVERDLKTIAVSIRNPGDANPELATVFTGNFDQNGLRSYMESHSTGSESYAGKTIFSIHGPNHLARACILDSSTVVVTNTDSADAMHGIIDKASHSYSFAEASPLVRDYYSYVPFGSLGWAMLRMPQRSGSAPVAGEFNMDFLQNSVSVLSVRYTGSIRIRAEVISASEADAAKVFQAANLFVTFTKGLAGTGTGQDKDVNAAFNSVQVQQTGKSTVLSATIPQAAVQKMADRMKH